MQFVGIDVSARTLKVSTQTSAGKSTCLEFENTLPGHHKLCRCLTRSAQPTRVVVEATGTYHLDLCLALAEQPGVEVMTVNPRAAQDFAKALLQRSKSDRLDAEVLREYAQRMPFQAWQPPSVQALQLRGITRRIADLTVLQTQEKNRLHAASRSARLSSAVQQDLEAHLLHLKEKLADLQRQALEIVAADAELKAQFDLMTSVPGIATKSALRLLGELLVLDPKMTPRQWVAHAGLDPRHVDSGTSVHKPPRISRQGNGHLREHLYMPALVAIQHDPHVQAFYKHLIDKGKKPRVAIVAVMRKLLHSLHAILRHRNPFDGEKFRALPVPANSSGTSAPVEQAPSPLADFSSCPPFLSEPGFPPVAHPNLTAGTEGPAQGRRSRRSEPLNRPPAPATLKRRRRA